MLVRLIPFYAAAFFGYLVNGITGFAGNVFILPAGFSALGVNESVIVLNIMGLVSSLVVVIVAFKHIVWREFIKMASVMFVFMMVGMWINTVVSADILKIIFGIFVLLIGIFYLVQKEGNTRKPPDPLLWCALGIGGVIQGMFVSGGPMAVVYALNKIEDKDSMRGTLSATWTVLTISYSIILIVRGQTTLELAGIAVIGIPIIIAATLVGNIISKHIKQQLFLRIVYILLIILGAFILIF